MAHAPSLAGSIYAVLLVALADQRKELVQSVGLFAWTVANVLRDPDPNTTAGDIVIQRIIPAIERIRGQLPLQFDALYSPQMLLELGVSSDALDCSNLEHSDKLFGSLILK
ncbi:uncharacterized protein B0H18DRAFT_890065 [Fomitopsis serialis]|uniref:uncharacterized protein n=1 Tax=Fomitopsis serialis TaxID=139415 RepID=UPI002008DF93|nr:uncharacterized protein B0H18DRAFT_898969 [Neoantrodia serialis]XP_047885435.1 uncharacterized protein B0H18DRAFT_890065 [Neoantrodia serialis]KAH9906097.1 hypothetical protein B0H18DRAFT_898969 [Neoantrodia serialis]KAH9912430.1 hypothetical protein B0H18DRAFT_890065 [Neoantrodia serialis]